MHKIPTGEALSYRKGWSARTYPILKYLPSSKILILLIVLGLGLAGWFWYFRQNPSPKIASVNPEPAGLGYLNADADQDGLKDWEEQLWGTDPNNPDTDVDGAPDGEEIKLRRNPARAGPNDRYEPPAPGENAEGETLMGESRSFTSQFLDAFANTVGPRILSGDAGKITPGDLCAIPTSLPSPEIILGELPYITADDLTSYADASPEAVKRYFNSVYAVYEKTFLTLKEDDLSILIKAVEGETLDVEALKRIDAVLDAFDKSIAEVKKIAVPGEYENFAITEINYLIKSSFVYFPYFSVRTPNTEFY